MSERLIGVRLREARAAARAFESIARQSQWLCRRLIGGMEGNTVTLRTARELDQLIDRQLERYPVRARDQKETTDA